MKKLLLFLLLLPLLFGCEMYLEEGSSQLNLNGRWKIVDITPTYSEDIRVVNGDFYAVSPFIVASTHNEHLLIQNDTTNIQGCYFYKNGYIWEFDYNQLIIMTNTGKVTGWYYIGYFGGNYNYNYFNLTDKYTGMKMGGVWQFATNVVGAFPSNVLYITVPEIEFSIDGPERTYDRLITQSITIMLMR